METRLQTNEGLSTARFTARASEARAVITLGNHRLFFRVTYSTLFPSQLWPLFYLETETHGNFYFILILGCLYGIY